MGETYSIDVQNNRRISDENTLDSESNENDFNIIINEGKKKGKIISVPSGKTSM